MKAIILAGGETARLRPLSAHTHRPMMPFLNRPLIEHQVAALRRQGFSQVGIACSPPDQHVLEHELGNGARMGVQIVLASDVLPRGAAGAIQQFHDFLGDEPFLVVHANTWLGTLDLAGLFRTHVASGAAASLAMMPETLPPTYLESAVFTPDGNIERFDIPHESQGSLERPRFCGVYVFSPDVLPFIPDKGYWDIKEQLLPDLCRAGKVVRPVSVDGFSGCIESVESYYKLQHDLLDERQVDLPDEEQIDDGVWLARGAEVAGSAYILGPVIIGRKCVIEQNARIIGPAVIGDFSRIEAGAVVRESILWSESHISRDARLEYCIVGGAHRVRPGARHRRVVLMGDQEPVYCDPPGRPRRDAASEQPVPTPRKISLAVKRVVDVVGAALLLILLAPVMAAIAVAVRLDSEGPIFFRQRRCGKGGREFNMIKFRTMVPDAERIQKELLDRNDVDGPVFKMFEDPRVTRVGRFLRRNSLDELPQLWNVLVGDMSLVGPRPLMMSEMRLCRSWRDLRLSVKPGITGIWQVNGRSATSFHDWIRHDTQYVQNWSLWLDLRVLAKTALWVVARTGAF